MHLSTTFVSSSSSQQNARPWQEKGAVGALSSGLWIASALKRSVTKMAMMTTCYIASLVIASPGYVGGTRRTVRSAAVSHNSSNWCARRRDLVLVALATSGFLCQAIGIEAAGKGGGKSGIEIEPISYDGRNPVFSVSAPARKIFAIGDLHGDLRKTEAALTMAGLLSCDGRRDWIGGSAVLVQVGDVLDRGDGEIAIMSLLKKLQEQAEVHGGAVLIINGNHETMNVDGEFRDTTTSGMTECKLFFDYCYNEHGGDFQAGLREWYAVAAERMKTPAASFVGFSSGLKARKFLFSPGGPLAMELAKNSVVLKVNNWLFAHGGVLPVHVEYGLERMNQEVADWMKGSVRPGGRKAEMPFVATRGVDSVVWSRLYSRESFRLSEKKSACGNLAAALKATGCKGLVVGHTPQSTGVNCECDGLVWRIDVGMSKGVLSAPPELLEIVDDQVSVKTFQSSATEPIPAATDFKWEL